MDALLRQFLDEGDRLSKLPLEEVEAEARAGNGLAVVLLKRADEAVQNLIIHGDGQPDKYPPICPSFGTIKALYKA